MEPFIHADEFEAFVFLKLLQSFEAKCNLKKGGKENPIKIIPNGTLAIFP